MIEKKEIWTKWTPGAPSISVPHSDTVIFYILPILVMYLICYARLEFNMYIYIYIDVFVETQSKDIDNFR